MKHLKKLKRFETRQELMTELERRLVIIATAQKVSIVNVNVADYISKYMSFPAVIPEGVVGNAVRHMLIDATGYQTDYLVPRLEELCGSLYAVNDAVTDYLEGKRPSEAWAM